MSILIASCEDTLMSLGVFPTTDGMVYFSSAVGMLTIYVKCTEDTALF